MSTVGAPAAGRTPGKVGRPVSAPCGTVAAYKRHRRNGEPPCGPCQETNSAYHRALYQARKAR